MNEQSPWASAAVSGAVAVNIPGVGRGFADPWPPHSGTSGLPFYKSLKAISQLVVVRLVDGTTRKRNVVKIPEGWMCLKTGSVFCNDGRCKTTSQVWIEAWVSYTDRP